MPRLVRHPKHDQTLHTKSIALFMIYLLPSLISKKSSFVALQITIDRIAAKAHRQWQ